MTVARAGFSTNAGVRFGKVGRPAKDPVRQRLRIYRAAGPLVLERGIRRTTIQAIARAACLSPGGIYHYFASKQQLMLYGLEPEALSRACLDAAAELHRVLASRPQPNLEDVIELFVDKNVRMLEFVRPALHAAVELGRWQLQRRLAVGIGDDADSLVAGLRALYPGLTMAEGFAEAIRRTILGLALDEAVTATEAERLLRWLFHRLVPELGGSPPNSPAFRSVRSRRDAGLAQR